MIKLSANLSFLFKELPFEKRFNAASKLGFKAVEFLFPYDYEISNLKSYLSEANIKLILFNSFPGSLEKGEKGIACLIGRENEFKEKFNLALEYAVKLNCPYIHIMPGIELNSSNKTKYRDIFKKNLFYAANLSQKKNITILIEAINNKDIPNYHLNYVSDATDIIKELDHPSIKLQLDLYHAQIMSGNITNIIEKSIKYTKHIQIAAPPYRYEPSKGEINYPFIFKKLDSIDYKGYIGCEYNPSINTEDSLKWAKEFNIKIIND